MVRFSFAASLGLWRRHVRQARALPIAVAGRAYTAAFVVSKSARIEMRDKALEVNGKGNAAEHSTLNNDREGCN